jgi:hypothetical protein
MILAHWAKKAPKAKRAAKAQESAGPREGSAKYIEQREGVYRLLRRSGLQIHLSSSHPVRLVGSRGGLADLLVRAAGTTELLAKS